MPGYKEKISYSLKSILHPSDFSRASEVAFAHALKFAFLAKAELSILHVAPKDSHIHWTDFPGVRQTLERWEILPEGCPKEEVAKLGLQVQKVVVHDTNPVRSVLKHLDKNHSDLIVLATHQHEGRVRWLQKSVAEPIARQSKEMTLFIPHGVAGFVSLDNGAITLQRMLIPVDKIPRPQSAMDAACVLARSLGCTEVSFRLIYVGNEGDMPAVQMPKQEGWKWEKIAQSGDVVEHILRAGTEFPADLVVMATQGHNGFLDALRGSTTEQVIRNSRCPVLAVPGNV